MRVRSRLYGHREPEGGNGGERRSVPADELREKVLTSPLADSWGADAAGDLWSQAQWIDEQLAEVPLGSTVRTENTPERSRLFPSA